jgi:hypothetical protein
MYLRDIHNVFIKFCNPLRHAIYWILVIMVKKFVSYLKNFKSIFLLR